MRIRKIIKEDSKDLFKWRNDLQTRKMSIKQNEISQEEHLIWFKNAINNPNIDFYIAELNLNKLGVCRLDYEKNLNQSKISININPDFRGRGIGLLFLENVISEYKKKIKSILIAEIKKENIMSKRLFYSAGFDVIKEFNNIVVMEKREELKFKKVDYSDCEILYELLKKRKHNISHKNLPSYEKHRIFIKNNPYFKWYIVYLFGEAIGSFYLKLDNSIGININYPTESIIKEVFNFILKNFSPQKEVKSLIPSYFFINIANSNKDLIKIIDSLDLIKIQVTYKLSN